MTSGGDCGRLVEAEVRRIGAMLGVPDFVYLPAVVRKDSAVREVGDGFLIAGELGAMLQVKTREPGAASTDRAEDATTRLERMLGDAVRQAAGSRREIIRRSREGVPPSVLPYRALGLLSHRQHKYLLDLGPEVSTWPVVVVVDHPMAIGVDLGFDDDVLAITLSDWRMLQSRLGSTIGVLTYLRRVLDTGARGHTHSDTSGPGSTTSFAPTVPGRPEVRPVHILGWQVLSIPSLAACSTSWTSTCGKTMATSPGMTQPTTGESWRPLTPCRRRCESRWPAGC